MKVELVLAVLGVALPTISVLVGILLSQSNYTKLDGRLGQVETRLDGRISSLETRLDGRISSLESRFHADMTQVIGKLTELEVRVTRVEEKQAH